MNQIIEVVLSQSHLKKIAKNFYALRWHLNPKIVQVYLVPQAFICQDRY